MLALCGWVYVVGYRDAQVGWVEVWLGVCLTVSGCVWLGVCGRVYVAGCVWSLGVYGWVYVVGYRDAQVGWVEVWLGVCLSVSGCV